MPVIIEKDENLAGNPLADAVDSISPLLEEEVGFSSGHVNWRLEREGDRNTLDLSFYDDFGGEAQARFSPDDLKNEVHLRAKLRDLKGVSVRVADWKSNVRIFLDRCRQWLVEARAPYMVAEEPFTVTEQRSGTYSTVRLRIVSGDQVTTVEPVATWIVGADGRIDLRGPGGPFVLVWRKQGGTDLESQWSWVNERQVGRLEPLTPELFRDLVAACLDG